MPVDTATTARRSLTALAVTLGALVATLLPAPADAAQAPTISAPSVSPTSLPAEGGDVRVSATIESAVPLAQAVVTVYLDNGGTVGGPMEPSSEGSTEWVANVHLEPSLLDRQANHQVEVYAESSDGGATTQAVGSISQDGQVQFDQAPTVTMVSVSPTVLPSSGGNVSIVASADDDRSVAEVVATIGRPDGSFDSVGMSPSGGTWEVSYSIPANASASSESWSVSVTVRDDLGQSATDGGQSVTVEAHVEPPAPPTITDVDLQPSTVGVDGGTVEVSATIQSAGGVSAAGVTVDLAGGGQAGGALARTEPGSDVWSGQVTIPANQGEDPVNHSVSISAESTDGGSALEIVGSIDQEGRTPFDQAPYVTLESVTPGFLVSSGGDVLITASAEDDSSVTSVTATLTGPGGAAGTVELSPTSGSQWSATYTIPANTEPAIASWAVSVTATDDIGQEATDDGLSVLVDPFVVETEVPLVTDVQIEPSSLPVEGGDVTVTATVTSSVGVESVGFTVYLADGGTTGAEMERVAVGSDVYRATARIPANPANDPVHHDVELGATGTDGGTALELIGTVEQDAQIEFDQAPYVTLVSVTPASLGSDGGEITIAATAEDDRSVAEVYASLSGSDGSTATVALEPTGARTWSAAYTLPANPDPAAVTWTVSATALDDIGQEATDGPLTVTVDGYVAPPEPPVFGDVVLSPSSVGPDGGTVTITAPITSPAGVTSAEWVVDLASGGQLSGSLTRSDPGSDLWSADAAIPPNYTNDHVAHIVSLSARAGDGSTNSGVVGNIDQEGQPQFDQAPYVSITSVTPTELPAAGGPVTIVASADDDRSVSEVYAVVTGPDGPQTIPLDAGPGGYEATFEAPANPSRTGPVTYTVSVTAVDDIGQQTSADGPVVTVAPAANAAPEIVSASATPASLAAGGGAVTIRSTAADPDGTLASVVATVTGPGGDTVAVPLTTTATDGLYEGTWTAPPNPTGTARSYAVSVTATDDLGATADRSAGPVSVAAAPPPDLAPEVSDASVAPSSLPASGGTVQVSTTASDDSAVEEVRALVTDPEGEQVAVALTADVDDRWTGEVTLPANSRFARARYDVDVVAVDDAGQEVSEPAGRVVVAARADAAPRVEGGSVSASGRIQATISDDRGLVEAFAVVTGPDATTTRVTLYAAAGSSAYEGQFVAPGPGAYTVEVVARDGAGQVTRVRIGSLSVLPPATAVVTVSDDRLRFGRVAVGETGRAPVRVTNSGTATAQVDLSVLGRRFDLVGPATLRLVAGESRRVVVELTPRRRGKVSGQLVLAAAGSPSLVVRLAGRGVR